MGKHLNMDEPQIFEAENYRGLRILLRQRESGWAVNIFDGQRSKPIIARTIVTKDRAVAESEAKRLADVYTNQRHAVWIIPSADRGREHIPKVGWATKNPPIRFLFRQTATYLASPAQPSTVIRDSVSCTSWIPPAIRRCCTARVGIEKLSATPAARRGKPAARTTNDMI